LGLAEVIERATMNAARVFNFGAEIGTLRPAPKPTSASSTLRKGRSRSRTPTADSNRRRKLVPVVTVRGGKLF